jgi:plastocyanin
MLNLVRFAAVAVLVIVLAACSSASSNPGGSAAGEADVTITAQNLAFDTDTITVPAGEPFVLRLDNRESAPHNVAIYTDESASQSLFVGDVITATTIDYEIPALQPGTYFFRCDVHPEMAGSVVAQ